MRCYWKETRQWKNEVSENEEEHALLRWENHLKGNLRNVEDFEKWREKNNSTRSDQSDTWPASPQQQVIRWRTTCMHATGCQQACAANTDRQWFAESHWTSSGTTAPPGIRYCNSCNCSARGIMHGGVTGSVQAPADTGLFVCFPRLFTYFLFMERAFLESRSRILHSLEQSAGQRGVQDGGLSHDTSEPESVRRDAMFPQLTADS